MRARRPGACRRLQPPGASERKPAGAIERLLIVLSVADRTPSPTGTSIRGCAPCERTTGRRRPPPRNPAARHRRPAGSANGRPQPAAGAPSSPARRPDRLAFYMGLLRESPEGPGEPRTSERTRPRTSRPPKRRWSSRRASHPPTTGLGCAISTASAPPSPLKLAHRSAREAAARRRSRRGSPSGADPSPTARASRLRVAGCEGPVVARERRRLIGDERGVAEPESGCS
jgi:hypothetical protein